MKIKEIKIVNQDESTEIADIGADAVNVDYNNTNVKLKLDELDATNNSLTTAQISLQNQINGLASGSPKGIYADSQAIKSANPDTGVYIATANGHIYSWTNDSTDNPIDLGVYQAVGIDKNEPIIVDINNELEFIEKNELDALINDWARGSLDLTTGAISLNDNITNKLINQKMVKILSNKVYIGLESGYQFRGVIFNENGSYNSYFNYQSSGSYNQYLQNKKGKYVRFEFKKSDGSDLPNTDIPSNSHFYMKYLDAMNDNEFLANHVSKADFETQISVLNKYKVSSSIIYNDVTPTMESDVIGIDGSAYNINKHILLNVNVGDVYLVTGKKYTTPYATVIFYDSNNDVIDYILPDSDLVDYSLCIPYGATKMLVNGPGTALKAIKCIPTNIAKSVESNKTIVCFGDSITQGVGILEPNIKPTKDYPTIMASVLDAIVYNGGVGGTRLTNGNCSLVEIVDAIDSGNWSTFDTHLEEIIASGGSKWNSLREQYQAIKSLNFDDVDIVTIAYGTNDWTSGKTLGDLESTNNTVLGALKYCIDKLLTTYPHLRIYVFTPCFRYKITGIEGTDSDTYVMPGSNLKLTDICDGIYNGCKELHIPCKNMYYVSNLNNYTKEQYMSDGVHRNEDGYKLLGTQYAKFIMSN